MDWLTKTNGELCSILELIFCPQLLINIFMILQNSCDDFPKQLTVVVIARIACFWLRVRVREIKQPTLESGLRWQVVAAEQLEQLRNDNQRLRDENGALIRVISKLSKWFYDRARGVVSRESYHALTVLW